MSLTQEPLDEKVNKTQKKAKPRKRHFKRHDNKRYCTGYPKGLDELVDNWDDVDCVKCLLEKKMNDSPELIEKLREKLKSG